MVRIALRRIVEMMMINRQKPPNLKKNHTNQQTYPTTLTAMLTQVNFLLNWTLDSLPQENTLTLEKVKKVKVGRRRREGWLVMILRELMLLRLRVEKMARRH